MLFTVDLIMSYDPCLEYPEERVRALIGEGKTEAEVAAGDIPIEDIIWLLVRGLDARRQRHFACDCAERALGRVQNPDPRSTDAMRIARLYADNKATDGELAAAYAAARAAARAAAYAAARAAARAAAYAAAYAAERQWHLERLLDYYKEDV